LHEEPTSETIGRKSKIKKFKTENYKRIHTHVSPKDLNKAYKSEMVTKEIIQDLFVNCTKTESANKNGFTELFEIKAKEKSYKQELVAVITKDSSEIDITPNLLMNEYEENIESGPKYVCVCCGTLEFRDSVEIYSS
jgi:hypothetical protein